MMAMFTQKQEPVIPMEFISKYEYVHNFPEVSLKRLINITLRSIVI